MDDNLIGKCFLVNGQLLKITGKCSVCPTYENYYMHEAIVPITKGYGIGYKFSSGAYYINKDIKQVDLTIWDKTLKLINLGNSVCVAILANAPTSPVYTGYMKLVYTYPNIVKVLTDNRSLIITPDHFSILYNHDLFLPNNVVSTTSTANISKDVYEKVYNNIVNTTNEIKKLWT